MKHFRQGRVSEKVTQFSVHSKREILLLLTQMVSFERYMWSFNLTGQKLSGANLAYLHHKISELQKVFNS
jgi:hypothetical protein